MMSKKTPTTALSVAMIGFGVLAGLASSPARADDQISIVGSSTVFPFSSSVAEEFGRATRFKTPIVESTGTGGGMKLFCAGPGDNHPDITDASRRIKKSEVANCKANGVGPVTEIKIGYDGIVMANAKTSHHFTLSKRQIWLALAARIPVDGKLTANPNHAWRDIDPSFPDYPIRVYGPPPTSGTRDAFSELALEGGCKTFPDIKALKKTDKATYKNICHSIREDGAFIEAGENDNLIVQKLIANPDALGVFGFSFLEQNSDSIQGTLVGGVAPTFENIAASRYPLSRALYIYVKGERVNKTPGIKEFLAEFTSEKAWGDYGYLSDKGLIPMPTPERKEYRARSRDLPPLSDAQGS